MLKNLEDTLHKTCLVGLSYFTVQGDLLKQNILAGKVVKVDSEMGITLELSTDHQVTTSQLKIAHFILPTDLSCWFNAPKGEFHTSQKGVKVIDPDYLITWDIFQTKAQESATASENTSTIHVKDSEQQWWQWHPRTQQPNVGSNVESNT